MNIKTLLLDIIFGSQEKELEMSFVVFKQKGGKARWFGWTTNKFEDRDGEILTDAAHVEFREYLDNNPDKAPELWIWHTPGTARKNKVDWWEYSNGFFMYSGMLEADEIPPSSKEILGMSHGFYVIERQGRYITKYRTFEVSELPQENAANPYTGFQIKEDMNMFTQRKRQFLVDRLGEEVVAKLENDTEAKERALEEVGADWKELNIQYEQEMETALAEKIAKASDDKSKNIVAQVLEALNIEGLQETLKALHGRIDQVAGVEDRVVKIEDAINHLLESEDARIAKALTPVEPFDWTLRPSQSKETVREEDLTNDEQAAVKEISGQLDWMRGLVPFESK
jgi:hypothetical protein